jgi:hypothetical protein
MRHNNEHLFYYFIFSDLVSVVDDCHLPEPHGAEENVGAVEGEVALHAHPCNRHRRGRRTIKGKKL